MSIAEGYKGVAVGFSTNGVVLRRQTLRTSTNPDNVLHKVGESR